MMDPRISEGPLVSISNIRLSGEGAAWLGCPDQGPGHQGGCTRTVVAHGLLVAGAGVPAGFGVQHLASEPAE